MRTIFGAVEGYNYPYIIHASLPIEAFDLVNAEKAIRHNLSLLSHSPGDKIVIACNTAHLLLPSIVKDYKRDFQSLIDCAIAEVIDSDITSVGVVGSPTTLRSELFDAPLLQKSVRVFKPTASEIVSVESSINNVIAGKLSQRDRNAVRKIATRMKSLGAQKVILGCSELSVLIATRKDFIDPIDCVVNKLLPKVNNKV